MAGIDIFGDAIIEPPPPALDRHGKPKRKPTRPDGYADAPGSGPAGETCGSCRHKDGVRFAKSYHKCALMKEHWTHGPKTDVQLRKNDRDFKQGDTCSFYEWNPERGFYTGHAIINVPIVTLDHFTGW